MNTYFGFKSDQDQAFTEDGTRIPVTKVLVADLPVVGKKTIEKDGYQAVKVALGQKKHASKSITGYLKDWQGKFPRFFREIRTEEKDEEKINVGKITIADIFNAGDKIKVAGISKGKGFAGGVKRHGFKGGPKTHGQSNRQRAPGSIGQTTTPGRVYKGKRMAGRMGGETKTVTGLSVFSVNLEEQTILVKGLIPGAKGGLVKIIKVEN